MRLMSLYLPFVLPSKVRLHQTQVVAFTAQACKVRTTARGAERPSSQLKTPLI